MYEPRDVVPPDHGEAAPVGAVPSAETLRQITRLGAPPIAVPPSCPRCWYRHDPDEECAS